MPRLNKQVGIPRFTPPNHMILAIGAQCYGVGATEEQAVRDLKRNAPQGRTDYIIHVVPYNERNLNEPWVTDFGGYFQCPPEDHCPHCR